MRLFAKTNIYYFFLSLPILIISGVACYYIITSEVRENNDELLIQSEGQVLNYLKKGDTITVKYLNNCGELKISKSKPFYPPSKFSDTLIFDSRENEMADYRMLTTCELANGQFYAIQIWRNTLEYEELIAGISTSLLIILIFSFIGFLVIQYWLNKSLWKPFNATLAALRSFHPFENTKPKLLDTTISEFSDLNSSVMSLMDRVILDFKNQKQFNENASHEMQTPIAVIKAKLSLLMQSKNLGENEIELISSIDNASSKLSQINKSLLLLTKIENRQFQNKENVCLNSVIQEALVFYEDHIHNGKFQVNLQFESTVFVNINSHLCFILVRNLVENSLRHNHSNGKINIVLRDRYFSISNTGRKEPLEIPSIFQRFHKQQDSSESIGLGMAIVKEIVDSNDIQILYSYDQSMHKFELLWPIASV